MELVVHPVPVRRSRSPRRSRLDFALAGTLCLFTLANTARAAEDTKDKEPNVLLLNSYHAGYRWTDSIVQGVQNGLASPTRDLSLDIEYLDARRQPASSHVFAELLREKFSREAPRIIIASDDAAVQFLIQNRSTLFSNTPVVFCGVNEYHGTSSYVQPYRSWMTGVLEKISWDETVDLAMRLHPDTRNLVAIGDPTMGAIADRAGLRFPYTHTSSIRAAELSASEIQQRLAGLPDNTVVLLGAFTQDRLHRLFTIRQSAAFVAGAALSPVYTVTKAAVGFGPVGGKVADGYKQGLSAAKMALRIMDGTSPADIPIDGSGNNEFLFDYKALQKWNIPARSLPPASIVVDRPKHFYTIHPVWIWSGLGFGAVQSVIIFLLLAEVRKRRQAEIEIKGHAAALAQSNYMLEQFAFVTAHDFQEPIRNVAIFTQLLKRRTAGQLDEEANEALGFVANGSNRLFLMVRGLLAWVRSIDTDQGSVPSADAGAVLAQVLDKQWPAIDSGHVTVDASRMPHIPMHATHLRQVLDQLIANALQHARVDDLRITISAENAVDACTLVVQDNGVGVPSVIAERVFGVFKKGDLESGERIGMGLAICRRILTFYGGRIWIESTETNGCRVVFTVPNRPDPVESAETASGREHANPLG